MNMAAPIFRLPTELLSIIAQSLCVHCENSNALELVQFNTPTNRANKTALSRLSRVCRRLRYICEPILYHYYSDSNLPGVERAPTNDKLVVFVHNILRSPALVAAVRALLLTHYDVPECERREMDLVRAMGKKQLKIDDRWTRYLVEDEGYDMLHFDLQLILVMAVKSNLEYLLLARSALDYGLDEYEFRDWASIGCLPRLKVLIFTGIGEHDYHIFSRSPLIEIAPNLEVLLASDCGCQTGGKDTLWMDVREVYIHGYSNYLAPPSLQMLRKLSLNGLEQRSLAPLLRRCARLEDLELYVDVHTMPSLADFDVCRKNLRRVVLSSFLDLDRLLYSGVEEEEYEAQWGFATAVDRYLRPIYNGTAHENGFCFRSFENLEILEVDQCVLYGRTLCNDTNERGQEHIPPLDLPSALPQTLRQLHIGFVLSWITLYPGLLQLAAEKAIGNFAGLIAVRIDPIADPVLKLPPEQVLEVETVMEKLSIVCIIGTHPLGPRLRGMLPERPDGPDSRSVLSELFCL
jgi:hypothetical protein